MARDRSARRPPCPQGLCPRHALLFAAAMQASREAPERWRTQATHARNDRGRQDGDEGPVPRSRRPTRPRSCSTAFHARCTNCWWCRKPASPMCRSSATASTAAIPIPAISLCVIDLEKRAHVGDIDLRPYIAPHTLKLGPDGLIYITCENSAVVAVIDRTTHKVVDAIDSGSTNGHRLIISPDGQRLYTENEEDGTVSVIDLPKRKLLGKIKTPRPLAGIAISADGRTVVAVDDAEPTLFLIDTESERVAHTVRLEGVPKAAQIARYSAGQQPDRRHQPQQRHGQPDRSVVPPADRDQGRQPADGHGVPRRRIVRRLPGRRLGACDRHSGAARTSTASRPARAASRWGFFDLTDGGGGSDEHLWRRSGHERRALVEGVIRRFRLASGLVMLAYVTTHFVNHSLGLVSVQSMDLALRFIYQYWASPLGTFLLYGAFAIHYSLALWALWLRRSLKMPAAEATQLVLGFFDSLSPHRTRPPDPRRRHVLWSGLRLLRDGALHILRGRSATRRASVHGAGDRLGPRHDRTAVLAAPEAVVRALAADPVRVRVADADVCDSSAFSRAAARS